MEFSEYIPTPKIEETILKGPEIDPTVGTTCLTGHHLIFYSHERENKEYWILYKNVDAVEKRYSIERNILILKCKDFKVYSLAIPKLEEANNVCNSIEVMSRLTKPLYQHPFFYRPSFSIQEEGYALFSVEKEFSLSAEKSIRWRMATINKTFAQCTSYPPQVIVPANVSDHDICKSAQFRHGGRFPVLSYVHTNGRVIVRCGQPLLGSTGNNRRCKADERLLNGFLVTSHGGYIMDTRSLQASQQARAKGGGSEMQVHYAQWKKIHSNLLKYAILQESLTRIVEACLDQTANSEKWQSKAESSNWLSYVKDVLAAACLAAQCVHLEGASLAVHGTEGIDSTLQVTSLAQIILDPKCRTMHGFLYLLDKEWIHAGHPFMDRCYQSALSNQKSRLEGPSFTVFLDCVYQLQSQFPTSFQFSSQLLLELHHHAYASQFGTFLFNNEMERTSNKVRTKTTSLWSYFLSDEILPNFLNPVYKCRNRVLWPSVAPQSLHFWDGLFLPDLDSTVVVHAEIKQSISEVEQLREELSKLNEEVLNLEKVAAENCIKN